MTQTTDLLPLILGKPASQLLIRFFPQPGVHFVAKSLVNPSQQHDAFVPTSDQDVASIQLK